MKSTAKTPDAYVSSLPADRKAAIKAVRSLVKKAVPRAIEGIHWGMIGWTLDDRFFAAVASQKNHLSLYLVDLYERPGLRARHEKELAKLAIGKSCINFGGVDELPLPTIAQILGSANEGAPAKTTKTAKKTKPARKTAR